MEITRKIDNELCSGEVTYQIPDYEERIKLLKETRLRVNGKGEVEVPDDDRVEEVLQYSVRLKNVADKYVKSLSIKFKSEPIEAKTINELLVFEEGAQLVTEFAHTILNGVKLGNASLSK